MREIDFTKTYKRGDRFFLKGDPSEEYILTTFPIYKPTYTHLECIDWYVAFISLKNGNRLFDLEPLPISGICTEVPGSIIQAMLKSYKETTIYFKRGKEE